MPKPIEPNITDIAHPLDSGALSKILAALSEVAAVVAALQPAGRSLDNAVPIAAGHLDEAANALRTAGERDLEDASETSVQDAIAGRGRAA